MLNKKNIFIFLFIAALIGCAKTQLDDLFIKGDIGVMNQNEIRFYEDNSNGYNYSAFKAPAALTANKTFTLPDGDGSSGQYLSTNGSAVLSWATPSSSSTLNVETISSADTLDSGNDVVLCDTSGGDFTIALPAAGTVTGKQYHLIYYDSNYIEPCTIDPDGSETIGGSSTTTLNTQNESLRIVSDGSNWVILDRRLPAVKFTYTPTVGGASVTSAYGVWWREANGMHIRQIITFASGSGNLTFSLPSGITVDASHYPNGASGYFFGTGSIVDVSGGNNYVMSIFITGGVLAAYEDAGQRVTNTNPFTIVGTDYVNIEVWVPISGWNP